MSLNGCKYLLNLLVIGLIVFEGLLVGMVEIMGGGEVGGELLGLGEIEWGGMGKCLICLEVRFMIILM